GQAPPGGAEIVGLEALAAEPEQHAREKRHQEPVRVLWLPRPGLGHLDESRPVGPDEREERHKGRGEDELARTGRIRRHHGILSKKAGRCLHTNPKREATLHPSLALRGDVADRSYGSNTLSLWADIQGCRPGARPSWREVDPVACRASIPSLQKKAVRKSSDPSEAKIFLGRVKSRAGLMGGILTGLGEESQYVLQTLADSAHGEDCKRTSRPASGAGSPFVAASFPTCRSFSDSVSPRSQAHLTSF